MGTLNTSTQRIPQRVENVCFGFIFAVHKKGNDLSNYSSKRQDERGNVLLRPTCKLYSLSFLEKR
jgi:hypothetical protein